MPCPIFLAPGRAWPGTGIMGCVGGSGLPTRGGARRERDALLEAYSRVAASVVPFIFILIGVVPLFFSKINLEKEQELSDFSELQHR